MNVGQKIISGFLLAVLVVVIVGLFGLRTSNKAREGSMLETEMSSLALKVAEKGTVTFAATLTKDLDEFARLKKKANQLRDEIDTINSTLLEDSAIKQSSGFQTFLAVKKDHDKDQEQVFRIHQELLARQSLFVDSPLVEESVRQRLRAILDEISDPELIKSFGSAEILRREAVFRYQNKESVDRWLESIRGLMSDIESKASPDRRLLNHFTVYLQTAEIVGEIVIRESETRTNETEIVSAMREREVLLGTLRKTIVDELSANISRTHQNNKNTLIVIIAGMLAVMGSASFFLSRGIIIPIKELTAVAMKIAGGNLKARARVFGTDEIGILARSFNQTADRLAEYPIKLQQEVEKRTEELTDANTNLQELLRENYISAKMLVARDLELTEANARLQDLDVIKSEFVSVAAHQLRTPLTGIRWSYVTLLEKETGFLASAQRKIVEDGLRATVRAIDLVNDLLNVARIEEGRFGFNMVHQSIVPVVEKAYKHFLNAAEEKGIRLLLKIEKDRVFRVLIDDEKIGILLENVLDNAVKYTSPGGEVLIRVIRDRDTIRIDVKDTGIGIPADQQRRVFTKFFRGDNAQLFQTSGTGLGLYVSKNIAEKHDGTLTFESVEGRGTAFTLTLPIAKEIKS